MIDGSLTASGRPLLANDPHLGTHIPSTWYLAHMSAGDFDVIGATLPGTPAVALGRNKYIAWGATNVGADVHRSFSAIGDTTNVAARLQALSTPGHITIAERTLREARSTGNGDIEAVSIGAVDLKGKAEPTEAYELISVGGESSGDR